MRIDVLGVGFDNLTMAEAVEKAWALLGQPGAHYVVTPNPEIVEVCRTDEAARDRRQRRGSGAAGRRGRHQGRRHAGHAFEEKTPWH